MDKKIIKCPACGNDQVNVCKDGEYYCPACGAGFGGEGEEQIMGGEFKKKSKYGGVA